MLICDDLAGFAGGSRVQKQVLSHFPDFFQNDNCPSCHLCLFDCHHDLDHYYDIFVNVIKIVIASSGGNWQNCNSDEVTKSVLLTSQQRLSTRPPAEYLNK